MMILFHVWDCSSLAGKKCCKRWEVIGNVAIHLTLTVSIREIREILVSRSIRLNKNKIWTSHLPKIIDSILDMRLGNWLVDTTHVTRWRLLAREARPQLFSDLLLSSPPHPLWNRPIRALLAIILFTFYLFASPPYFTIHHVDLGGSRRPRARV